ncbi:MAG: HAD family hydrolase [Chitinophagaceae bacterium]
MANGLLNGLEAVIFDMDGTLLATTEADFLAWKRLFQDHEIELTFEKYYPLLGRKSADVVHEILGKDGKEAEMEMHKKMVYFEEIAREKGIEILPHVEQFLIKLEKSGIPMALATSSRKMKMNLMMEMSGLEKYFKVFITGDQVKEGKPHPEMFLLAAEKLGVLPGGCLVVEDAIHGVTAAKAAGMKCAAVLNTHESFELTHADIVINDFSELVDILDTVIK